MEENPPGQLESQRLSALYQLQLLGTSPEPDFDSLVKLAAELCEAPISLITLVDEKRLWIKAKYGVELDELSRENAFCNYAIGQREVFVVSDATKDERFCETPLVKGEANIQFYAGIPLLTEDGFAVGVLTVLDHVPRVLSEKQLSTLRVLGSQVSALLRLRLKIAQLDQTNRIVGAKEKALQESANTLSTYFNSSNEAVFLIDPTHTITAFNRLAETSIEAIHGRKLRIGENMLSYIDSASEPDYRVNVDRALSGEEIRVEKKVDYGETHVWWAATFLPVRNTSCEIIGVSIASKDINRWKKAEEELKESEKRLNLVLAGVNDGWWDWDLTNQFLFYSPKWWLMIGYLPDELPITSLLWHDLLHPDDVGYVDDFLKRALDNGTVTYEVEFRLKHKKGYYVPVLSRGYILRDEKGKPVRISGSNMDLTDIKKAEQALKQSKDFITGITDNLPTGVIFQYVMSAGQEEHSFTYVSSGAKDVFGHSAEEIMNDPMLVFNLVQPDTSLLLTAIKYSFEHLTLFDLQYQIMVEGKMKWLHTKSTPKRLPNGDIQWDGITIDITEQMLATEVIRKTKRDQQVILKAIPDLLFRFDGQDYFTYCHTSNPNDLLVPVEDFIGKKLDDVMPTAVAPLLKNTFAKARNTGNVEFIEYSLDMPNIGEVWFEARIVKSGQEEVISIVRNITEKRRAEEALQKSEANLATVFENTEVGYYLFNEAMEIVSFNAPAQRFTMAEFYKSLEVGNYFFDYFPKETRERLQGVIKEVFEGKKVEYERLFPRSNGEDKWYNTKYSPVFNNKDNKVVGVLMSTEDITERKRNEIALTRSFDLVTDQNKRLLNFSYIVSHNLRSHTSNIKSILGLLPYADSEAERNKMIELLSVASNSLNETIHNLNDVISVQTNLNLVTEPINLKEGIDKTIVVLSEQIALKNAEVRILVDEQLTVNYNPAYLESILFNFISNAIKYSHPDRLPVITVSCSYQDERWVLGIADNGIGIDLKIHGEQLFGMYKTFNGNSDARGIGLFISKNQIEAMGGKVEIDSELDKGTTFRIYIK